MTRSSIALAGFTAAGALMSAGAVWFSVGAGLIVAGLCVAALTALATVEVGGDDV